MPTTTPRVPIQTPMFDQHGNLTRTWVIYFERLGERDEAGGGTAEEKRCATFNLATDGGTGELQVGKSTPYVVPAVGGTLEGWTAIAKNPCSGGDIVIDVRLNGTSILPAGKITIPDSSSDLIAGAAFSPAEVTIVADSDLLDAIVDQVGAEIPGGEVSITLWYA